MTDDHRRRLSDADPWIYQQWMATTQTVGGMDIGKVCHLSVKAKVGKFWHVIWTEKIRNAKDDPAAPKVLARYDYYRMARLCIDAGPDITLVNTLVASREGIRAVVYIKSVPGILPIKEKAAGDVINADRTKALSLLLEKHNTGIVRYPRQEYVTKEIFEHLKTTKKIRFRGSDGELTERFTKTSDIDHWVHSLNYASIAAMAVEDLGSKEVIGAAPMVGRSGWARPANPPRTKSG